MAHTYTSNLVHCVFSTQERRNSIPDPPRLWQYIGGIARQKKIVLLAAGGTANHVHLFVGLPATLTLSKAVQEVKGNTSRWLNELRSGFAWQQGYSAFSVCQSQRQTVIDYIDGQTKHHAKWSFEQEYLTLLKKSGIAYDSRFVFGSVVPTGLGADLRASPALKGWARRFRLAARDSNIPIHSASANSEI